MRTRELIACFCGASIVWAACDRSSVVREFPPIETVLRGSVATEDGEPVAGARVQVAVHLIHRADEGCNEAASYVVNPTTGADGTFAATLPGEPGFARNQGGCATLVATPPAGADLLPDTLSNVALLFTRPPPDTVDVSLVLLPPDT